MAEGRMLKKKISKSRKLAALPSDSDRLFYTWLIPHLDIEGRILADAKVLKGEIVPRLKNWNSNKVQETLETLAKAGVIILYNANGDQYLELKRFKDEQRLDPAREAKSQCPVPPTKRKSLLKADYDHLWDTWKKDGMVCPECGRKAEFVTGRGLVADGYIPFHIDHIKPLSKGGTNNKDNLRVVCRECNLKKGNEFIPELVQSDPELVQRTPTQVKLSKEKIREYITLTPDQEKTLKDRFPEDRFEWMLDKLDFWADKKKKVINGYRYFKKGSWLLEEMEKHFNLSPKDSGLCEKCGKEPKYIGGLCSTCHFDKGDE